MVSDNYDVHKNANTEPFPHSTLYARSVSTTTLPTDRWSVYRPQTVITREGGGTSTSYQVSHVNIKVKDMEIGEDKKLEIPLYYLYNILSEKLHILITKNHVCILTR